MTIEKVIIDQVLYDEIGICDDRCRRCEHGVSEKASLNCCNYIDNTKHRRPCPAGENCTVFVRKPKKKKQ